jgi:1,4-dihydroxy-2-naphthoyl-CoA hydrolase
MDTSDQVRQFVESRNEHTVFKPLDIRIDSFDPEAVTVSMPVDERHHQHAGILHGGLSVLLCESAASTAAALTVDMAKFTVAGLEINANHLRRVSQGRVTAVATPIHRGKTTHVYGVEVRDDEDRLVCVCRCTIAVRPLRPGFS